MISGRLPQWGHLQTWLLLVVLIVLAAISAVTLAAAQKANHNAFNAKLLVASLARQRALDAQRSLTSDDRLQAAIVGARHAEYRICRRQMATRVAVNFLEPANEPKLKLYDCAPNLIGGAAKLFTPAQAAAFTRRFASLP